MPELCRFYNIVIKMLYSDDAQHHRPHFHVYYNEYEASVGVDGELLAGSLPVKQLKLVQAWAVIHEEELYVASHMPGKKSRLSRLAVSGQWRTTSCGCGSAQEKQRFLTLSLCWKSPLSRFWRIKPYSMESILIMV